MRRDQSKVNALLAVDKPLGMTSHDVVSAVRRALGERRVGHAGTLDPDASGVLVLGIGQATKLLGRLTLDSKSYEARVRLGSETTTDDAEGEVVKSAPVPGRLAEPAVAAAVVASMAGSFDQVPPDFSAVSVNGRRAYALARAGESVELAARPVTVFGARLDGVEAADGNVDWLCSFDVSKGCYIRSLARDLGRELGCYAHLAGLRRTSSGSVDIRSAVPLSAVEELGLEGLAGRWLDPVAVMGLSVRAVTEQELADAADGKRIPCGTARSAGQGSLVALVRDGRVWGIWRVEGPSLVCDLNLVRGVERGNGAR